MPDLRLYTAGQLHNWLIHNCVIDGLSRRIISPARARAITNNPYIKDEDPVLSVIFVEGEVAAYTSAFPEMIDGKRYWWFSALWCDPKYRGNGFGLVVIGNLAEFYGVEHCLDRWGALETVEIFSYLGLHVRYTSRYTLECKNNRKSAKGKLIHFIHSTQEGLHKILRSNPKEVYSLNYLSHIDDVTYDFIRKHRGDDCFLHTQEFMNWVLHYPFSISAPLIEHVMPSTSFAPSETLTTQLHAVQVLDFDKLIGFYLLKCKEDVLHILYLYYDCECKNKVFASIRDHVKKLHVSRCVTENQDMASYLKENVFSKQWVTENISFSYPNTFEPQCEGSMQYGDGDCFA